MKTQIDLKSALLGLLAGILITFTIGAASNPPGPVERFHIAASAQGAFVIDTATGQVWRGHASGGPDANFSKAKLGNE